MLDYATVNVFAADFAMLSAATFILSFLLTHGRNGRETESMFVLMSVMSKVAPATFIRRAPTKWPDPAVWAQRQVTTGRGQPVCRFWSI